MKKERFGNDASLIGKELDPQMKIYLLVAPHCKDFRTTVGFKDIGTGKMFTFGFTSIEKLKAFVECQKKLGKMGNMSDEIRTYWLTLQEYTDKPENHPLCIDPVTDFPMDFGMPNLN